MQNSELPKRINDYEITQPLGRGEYTSVYLAIHSKTNQKVALKTYSGPYLHDKLFQKRFDRELSIISQLDHPNLVRYFDNGIYQGCPFIVMEYLTGLTLQRLIAHHGTTHPAIAVGIMKQVLDALAYLHKAGIVHRDIKPSAIFISTKGQVKLADFDIAKRADDTTLTIKGTVIGSPNYMSPEQRLGGLTTTRSDVYSAGITFYEMLVGKIPWEDSNFLPTDRRSWANFSPPGSLIPGISPKIDEIIVKAVDLQPGRRFKNAQEMAAEIQPLPAASMEDIAAWARGRKISSQPVKVKKARRSPYIGMALFLLVLICLAGAIFALPQVFAYLNPSPTPTATFIAVPSTTPLATRTPSLLHRIFADDFSDPQRTEAQWLKLSGIWDSTQGVYTCRKQDNSCISLESQEVTSDYMVAVDVRSDAGTDKIIYLGYVENQKNISVLLRSDPINQITVMKHIEGQPAAILAQLPFEFKNKDWYRVDVVVTQSSLKVNVNDKQVLDLAIDNSSDWYGRIGLGIPSSSDNGTIASFDNFVVDVPDSATQTHAP